MIKILYVTIGIIFATNPLKAQFSLTGNTYSQNFDGLGLTTSSALTGGSLGSLNANLNGWYFYETNTTGKNIITVGTGNSSSGDTYNVGINNTSTDRSLGSLQSSGEAPRIGFWFQNDTGSTITGLSLSYRGETWRIGATNRSDSLTFATSTDAAALNLGTWTDNVSLGYTNNSAGATSTTGGTVLQSANISGNLGVLSLVTGAKMFLRWTDFNASGSDDLLAINNFSLTATLAEIAASYGWGGGSGAWQHGQNGMFSAAYNNATNSAVTFSGTAGTVTVSGSVQAGSLTFTSGGYELTSGSLNLGQGSITTDTGTTTIGTALEGTSGLTKAGAGVLVLNGANTLSGAVTVTAGTLQINADTALGNLANDIVNNGTLKTTSNTSLSSGRDLGGAGILDIANGTTLTVNGNVTNTATTLASSGTLDLQGATRSVGNLTVNAAATVNGSGAISASGLTASGLTSGTATINPDVVFTSNDKTLNVASGGTLDLNGVLSNGGGSGRIVKTGAGTLILGAANNMGGVRIGATGTTMTDGGKVVLESSSVGSQAQAIQHNYGTLEAATALTINKGISIGGRVNGAATLAGSDMEFQGQSSFFRGTGSSGQLAVNVNNTTTLSGGLGATSGSGTATGVTLGGNGTLKITGNSSTFAETITTADSVKLVVNNTLGGGVNVSSGTVLSGSGAVTALTVASGGVLSPGNSPGTMTASSMTWAGGAKYIWEINDFLGSQGSNWDFLNVSGGLTINASSGSKFLIDIVSLLASTNGAGAADNFDLYSNYSFAIATAAGGITYGDAGAFSADRFLLSTTGFANSLSDADTINAGFWSIAQDGNSLKLNYTAATAIPEPSSASMLVLGLAAVLAKGRRSRR